MSKPAATWNDIPPEIIEKILEHSDDSSLLALSKCNRDLNRLALCQYLEPETTRTLEHHSVHPVCSPFLQKKDIIYALNIALWLPPILRLCWFFPFCADEARFVRDIKGLTSFISKCTPPLKTLWVGSIQVHRQKECLLLELWSGLLEAALSKGCETLALEGPCGFRSSWGAYYAEPPLPSTSRPQITWRNYSAWNDRYPGVSRQRRSLPHGRARLRELEIEWDILLRPPFLPYFSGILQQHAATLCRLSITSYEEVSDDAWEEYFASLHFPSLESLEMKLLVQPQQIIDFLSRHPTLTTLEIACLGATEGWPKKAWAILPSLRSLKGNAQAVAWLLKCSDACPQLSTVHVGLECNIYLETSCCIGLDEAIGAIGGSSSTVPLELKIDIDFGLMSSLPWMRQYIARGAKKRRLRRSLDWSRVTKLELRSKPGSFRFQRVPELMMQWLALFTSLEKLQIQGRVFEDDLSNRDFCDAIRAACPKLKVFRYNYGDVIPQGPTGSLLF